MQSYKDYVKTRSTEQLKEELKEVKDYLNKFGFDSKSILGNVQLKFHIENELSRRSRHGQ